jgi:hypothetical protein
MTISVAGRPIPQAASLSELCRLVLAFIDGGQEWLAWALATPTARYDFADETTLVAQVQQGLHASPLALLPVLTLLVSPVKLMTLGLADLRALAKAESGDTSTVVAAQMQRVLADHRLLPQADLAAVDSWLAGLGVDHAPLFQAMGLAERVALCELMRGPNDPDAAPADVLDQEAAAFAIQQARTPLECVDYVRFYQALAAQPGASAQTPEARANQATQTMQGLLPLFFGALDCPQLSGLPSPGEVSQTVSGWLTSGRRVGFSRLSEGLQQFVRHTSYHNETGDAAQRLVELYIGSAQSFLAAARPRLSRMGQDGSTCTYTLEAGNQQAELQLGANGVISLRSYGLQPSATAVQAPTPPAMPQETAS